MVNGAPGRVTLAIWPGPEAADRYAQTTPLIAAYGVADLFGALEDIVFDLYEIFCATTPLRSCKARNRELRRLWHQRQTSPESRSAWEQAWIARFDAWRRKKAYDGLHRVLRAFFDQAGLRRPSHFRHTDIDDWCRTLEMIGALRHHVVHGAAAVSDKLGRLSGTPTSLTFDFRAGERLDVKLHHLQSVECFADQLFTALNFSLVERAVGPIAHTAERDG
jgi:hypothetical protein